LSDPRAISDRGTTPPPRLVDPKTSSQLDADRYRDITRKNLVHPDGRSNTLEDIERANQAHAQMLEERHVWRFRKPDGSELETSWKGLGTPSTAKAFADYFGLTLLGEVRKDSAAPSQQPPAPKPPVQLPQRPPAKVKPPAKKHSVQPPPAITPSQRGTQHGQPTTPERIGGPPPPAPRPQVPFQPRPPVHVPEESLGDRIIEYMKEHFVHTTMTESMPLISKWFGRVGDVLEKIPPLRGVGEAYKLIAEIADAANLLYELIHEMSQAQALEKGGKEVIKRTQPAKVVAERILKKKYPNMPDKVRKEMAKKLEELFERYVSDPAIRKGRETMEKMDQDKELKRPFIDELKALQKRIEDSFILH